MQRWFVEDSRLETTFAASLLTFVAAALTDYRAVGGAWVVARTWEFFRGLR